jgi:hypothetical protein
LAEFPGMHYVLLSSPHIILSAESRTAYQGEGKFENSRQQPLTSKFLDEFRTGCWFGRYVVAFVPWIQRSEAFCCLETRGNYGLPFAARREFRVLEEIYLGGKSKEIHDLLLSDRLLSVPFESRLDKTRLRQTPQHPSSPQPHLYQTFHERPIRFITTINKVRLWLWCAKYTPSPE